MAEPLKFEEGLFYLVMLGVVPKRVGVFIIVPLKLLKESFLDLHDGYKLFISYIDNCSLFLLCFFLGYIDGLWLLYFF